MNLQHSINPVRSWFDLKLQEIWRYRDLLYSGIFTVVIFFVGLAVFNRTEKNFMDTV